MEDRLELDALYFECYGSTNVLHRLSMKYRLKFCKCSVKLDELLKVLKGNTTSLKLKHMELLKVAEDIGIESNIVPYMIKDNILALLAEGKTATYIAMVNLSKDPVKLYADMSHFMDIDVENGVITEIFSDMNYLVSEGKIYVRKLPSMDCMLFAKYK